MYKPLRGVYCLTSPSGKRKNVANMSAAQKLRFSLSPRGKRPDAAIAKFKETLAAKKAAGWVKPAATASSIEKRLLTMKQNAALRAEHPELFQGLDRARARVILRALKQRKPANVVQENSGPA